MDYKEIADLISNAEKKTPVKVYIKGGIDKRIPKDVMVFDGKDTVILIGDYKYIEKILRRNKSRIEYFHIENNCRNSARGPVMQSRGITGKCMTGTSFAEDGTFVPLPSTVSPYSTVSTTFPSWEGVALTLLFCT